MLRFNVAPVAPVMFVPPFCHWYVGAGVPVAVTLKLAEPPAVTVWLLGWVVIEGAVLAPGFTVIEYAYAGELLPLPPGLSHALNVTEYDPAVVGVP